MLIGLTGKNACGKGEVAKYLIQKGFDYFSLSNVVRDLMKKRKIPITRENMISFANQLRQKYGSSVLADMVIKHLDMTTNCIIDSIRNPGEVIAFRKIDKFVLLNIISSPEIRFERIKKRNRPGDPKTFEEFQEMEKKELKDKENFKQQLLECEKLSDYKIENNSSLKQLYKKIDNILNKTLFVDDRPSWDEYFMNIAKVIATRSNCMKRRVAAIIVKDRRIISTGYNGTPRGTKNCNEGGCPRCNSFSASGKNLEDCLCSHAEENAIVQAAYHGVSIKDATLYTTFSPCIMCAKMIINSGIRELIYYKEYTLNKNALKLLKEAKIKIKKLNLIKLWRKCIY